MFLDTLSTFSRYSVDVLCMFSRCSQDLLGFLGLGCLVGLVGRVGFAGLIGWVGLDGLVGLLLNLTGLVGPFCLVGLVEGKDCRLLQAQVERSDRQVSHELAQGAGRGCKTRKIEKGGVAKDPERSRYGGGAGSRQGA